MKRSGLFGQIGAATTHGARQFALTMQAGVRRFGRLSVGRKALALGGMLLVLVALGIGLQRWFTRSDATLALVQARGVWRVGMDPSFPPFENLDATSGEIVGLDVDLARAIAAQWGVKTELVGVGFDELIDAVTAHKVDAAISALPIVSGRTQEVSFSDQYIEGGVVLAAPAGSSLTGTLSLRNRTVAVEWGSAGDAEARALQKELSVPLTLLQRETAEEALAAAQSGEASAAIVDAVSMGLFDRRGGTLVVIGRPLRTDPYVVMVAHDSPALLREINFALAGLSADGTLASLKSRWLSPEVP
jgi:ABC-type amino acid transport substrate-binding protein